MMKYTEADVIVTHEQARGVKLITGAKCAFGNSISECVDNANKGNWGVLFGLNFLEDAPFHMTYALPSSWYSTYKYAIKKKMNVKYGPYDFSKKEDRDALIGKRVYSENDICIDSTIIGFKKCGFEEGTIWTAIILDKSFSGEYLFENFDFADTGKPVGKPVGEVEE